MYTRSMKSKIILISIFFIAFLAVSSVNAADNTTVEDINVTFDSQVYKEDLGYIEVEIPENTSGNLKATINDVEFYNENVTSSVQIPVSIPDRAFPVVVPNKLTDHRSFSLYLYFNNMEIKSNHTLNVMFYPPDYEIPAFPDEILQYDDSFYPALILPELMNGTLDIYVDGEFRESLQTRQFLVLNATYFNSLALGNHTFRAVFSGDKYYKKFDKTFNFTVVDMTIHIPSRIILDHDDCIVAKTLNNTDGIVTIYVDGEAVFKDSLDKYGEFLYSLFDDVTCGQHLVEVEYIAKNFTKSKKAVVNVEYYLDIIGSANYRYGEDVELSVIFPSDAKKQFIKIALDGVEIKKFTLDRDGWVNLNLNKLAAGNHSLRYSYEGDKKYNNLSDEFNFTVSYSIDATVFLFFNENHYVALTLPDDASGKLEVYINDELFASSKLNDGDAVIPIENLIPGEYRLLAKYTGDDYNVSDVDKTFIVKPDITCPYEVLCGEDKQVTVIGSKNVNATATFMIGMKNYTVQFKNGKASFSLKDLKVGEHDVDVRYQDENGFSCMVYSFVDVLKPSVKISNVKTVYTQNGKVKVYAGGNPAKNVYVTFRIAKKTLKVKTDKNGVAILKTSQLKPGTYTITASYLGAKSTKKLTVKHIITLNNVKVKKSTKKVTLKVKLSKKLKNKQIKFKFNGKTMKAKTDKNGIAKVTFKNLKLKAGKRVAYSATYLKDTVKKTIKVGK
ncbi:Ig-like domain-containing protein [Methanobrevibacter sp.]|uniref:Ig-like domain-containing protein n=1 Tax=Methanobrevibacter sp. TaxID=66852 RepID=UPI00388F0AB7